MIRFILLGTVLQVIVVLSGRYVEAVRLLSPTLATAIPFLLGLAYGATRPTDIKGASRDGFLIGAVGAFAAVLVAVLLGDEPWSLLSFAPWAAGFTGLFGAIIGMVAEGRHRRRGD